MNLLSRLFSKPEQATSPALPEVPYAIGVAENCARQMVRDYMLDHTDEAWDISFITITPCGEEGISVNIFSPKPGSIIGMGSKRMIEMRKYIGNRLAKEHGVCVPVFVNARFRFDPIADSPLEAIKKSENR